MNNDQIDNSSPTSNLKIDCNNGLSTPKTNKSIYDSKSPFHHKIRLKKSKKRECTPAYSPKGNTEMDLSERNMYYPNTDQKNDSFADRFSYENIDQSRMSNLNYPDQYNDNNSKIPVMSGKKFLALIEESLNEVNDSYFGVLSSQITPDTVFQNIFNEENKNTKNPEKKSLFGDTIENQINMNQMLLENPEKKTHPLIGNNENLAYEEIFNLIKQVLDEIKLKNFDFLSFMVFFILIINFRKLNLF